MFYSLKIIYLKYICCKSKLDNGMVAVYRLDLRKAFDDWNYIIWLSIFVLKFSVLFYFISIHAFIWLRFFLAYSSNLIYTKWAKFWMILKSIKNDSKFFFFKCVIENIRTFARWIGTFLSNRAKQFFQK